MCKNMWLVGGKLRFGGCDIVVGPHKCFRMGRHNDIQIWIERKPRVLTPTNTHRIRRVACCWIIASPDHATHIPA